MGWQDDFKLKSDLFQRDIVKFELAISKYAMIYSAANLVAANFLKAAIEAEWVVSPPCEVGEFAGDKRYYYDGVDVDDMHPGKLRWIGDRAASAYNEAVSAPPN
jgi:hypothetical protein